MSAAGGILCARCAPPGSTPIAESVWITIVELGESPTPVAAPMAPEHRERMLTMFVEYLSYHSDKSLRLRSLDLLRDFSG